LFCRTSAPQVYGTGKARLRANIQTGRQFSNASL
jgi:hypothetical protein